MPTATKDGVIIQTGFGPLVHPPVHTETDYTKDKDIVEYAEVEKVVKTGEGDSDFIVVKEVVESSRINRADYIQSFNDDVGIKNILKKVQLTGDVNLLNQRGVSQSSDVVDLTQFPNDKTEAFNAVKKGVDAFDKLPDEVKGKMSMESFVNYFGEDKLKEFIEKNTPKAPAADDTAKGDK